jgi:hypothetical protein
MMGLLDRHQKAKLLGQMRRCQLWGLRLNPRCTHRATTVFQHPAGMVSVLCESCREYTRLHPEIQYK